MDLETIKNLKSYLIRVLILILFMTFWKIIYDYVDFSRNINKSKNDSLREIEQMKSDIELLKEWKQPYSNLYVAKDLVDLIIKDIEKTIKILEEAIEFDNNRNKLKDVLYYFIFEENTKNEIDFNKKQKEDNEKFYREFSIQKDEIRIKRIKRFNKVIVEFYKQYWFIPLTWELTEEQMEELKQKWFIFENFYDKKLAVCTNTSKNLDNNKIYQWFFQELNKDYKKFVWEIGWDIFNQTPNWWFVYKSTFEDWRFKYVIAIPLENKNDDARSDGWKLWDRFFEIGNDKDFNLKKIDLDCMEYWGKLPYFFSEDEENYSIKE